MNTRQHVYPIALSLLFFAFTASSQPQVNGDVIKAELQSLLTVVNQNYVYLSQKNTDLNCLSTHYSERAEAVKDRDGAVLFFEYFLNEFYDSHMSLNTNIKASYRLKSPLYVGINNDSFVLEDVWVSETAHLQPNLFNAQVNAFNEKPLQTLIDQFPIYCADKNDPTVREWIANKVLAGRYDQPRILDVTLSDGEQKRIDLDKLEYPKHTHLLRATKEHNIGIIRLHDSLGESKLIAAFDQALDQLKGVDGLIIDLRNTKSGGSSYVARGIMGRFISQPMPYQQHSFDESYDGQTIVPRQWFEYVVPRGETFKKPVVILVNYWTGSMGEGLAIGFDGLNRATVIGNPMARLAGAVNGYRFKQLNFGYQLPVEKLSHIHGTPREQFIPKVNVSSLPRKPIESENNKKYEKDPLLQRAISHFIKDES